VLQLEYVKQTKSWASQQAVDGAERVSESVSNLMKTLETQAKLYKVKVLLDPNRSLRLCLI
jgi:hypothetical protein